MLTMRISFTNSSMASNWTRLFSEEIACPSSSLRSHLCVVGVVPTFLERAMRPWKAVLGIGAACAACCAIPLAGGVAALAAGSTTLVAAGSALLVTSDEYIPAAAAAMTLGLAGLGAWWWRRRLARRATSCVRSEDGHARG